MFGPIRPVNYVWKRISEKHSSCIIFSFYFDICFCTSKFYSGTFIFLGLCNFNLQLFNREASLTMFLHTFFFCDTDYTDVMFILFVHA